MQRKFTASAIMVALACLSTQLLAQTAPATGPGTPATGPGAGRGRGRGGMPQSGTLPAEAPGKDAFWGTWPSSDPKIVGTRIAQNLLSRRVMSGGQGMVYPESCTGYGSLRFARAIGDKALAEKIIARYAGMLTPEGASMIAPADHVDRSMFGIVPFEISRYYATSGDISEGNTLLTRMYADIGKKSADLQWDKPQGREATADEAALMKDGLTWQSRFWVDDMFMITGLQVQAYRATKQKVYLDRAAHEMVAYLDKLQKPNGLFFHAEDSPFYWGRGNGWFAVGMAELLMDMPADHPDRARVLEGYKKMMAALLQNQAADGMWRQLIDKPESWPETSCTGMFTFSMAVGVRKGWLAEPQYKTAARKAWIALCGYFDDDANIREVCAGTNKSAQSAPGTLDVQLQYYLDRPRNVGDLHGQAGAIWAAWAMCADIK